MKYKFFILRWCLRSGGSLFHLPGGGGEGVVWKWERKWFRNPEERSEAADNIRNRENQKSRYNRKPPKPKPTQHAMQTHTAYERFDLGVRGAKESGWMHYDLLQISYEDSIEL